MEQDKLYVLHNMKQEAIEILRAGYMPKDKPIELMFQIVCVSSFGEDESLEVFKSKDDNNLEYYFAVKSTWDKVEENKKLDAPLMTLKIRYNKINLKPTIKHNRVNVNESKILDLITEVNNLKISPVPSEVRWGCDGNTYELTINKILYKSHFKWWEDGPSNWSSMTTLVHRIIDELNEILNCKKNRI